MQYILRLENDRLLEVNDFVAFCKANEHRAITLYGNHEGHCLRFAGVYDLLDLFEFESVQINTANALENHDRYDIFSDQWTYWLSNLRDFDFDFDYKWNRNRIFGVVYGRPSAQRLGITRHLLRDHEARSRLVTKFDFSSEDSRRLFDINRLFEWDPDAVSDIQSLTSTVGHQHHYQRGYYQQSNTLSHVYKDFLIDIVAEPTCHGQTFYPTEKLARAVLCRRPFIVMASQNYLAYLRQIGFRTFDEFWDEDYDGVDSNLRYRQILKLTDDLGALSAPEIENMYKNMQDILQHNFDVLVNQTYALTVTAIS